MSELEDKVVVSWLLNVPATNIPVCHKDGSAQATGRVVPLRQNLWIKLSFSSSHNILTPG